MIDRERPLVTSVQFGTREGAERALEVLTDAGIPRDLISFAVSEQGALTYFDGKVEGRTSQMLESAVKGALVGLVLASLTSAFIVLWPQATRPRAVSIIQLLGPNVGLMLGALLGVLWVLIVPPVERLTGVPVPQGDNIVVSLHGLDRERANRAIGLLEGIGGARYPAAAPEEER